MTVQNIVLVPCKPPQDQSVLHCLVKIWLIQEVKVIIFLAFAFLAEYAEAHCRELFFDRFQVLVILNHIVKSLPRLI